MRHNLPRSETFAFLAPPLSAEKTPALLEEEKGVATCLSLQATVRREGDAQEWKESYFVSVVVGEMGGKGR